MKQSYLPPLFNGAFLLLLFWLAGFLVYAHDVVTMPGNGLNPNLHAGGIVVLTGGSERVPAGLDLLQNNFATRLLISGVDPRVDAEKLIQDHPAKARLECCITLGVFAEDTHGNAKEAAGWVKKYDLKSLIIITSNYHMRRAMMEFHQTLPDITLYHMAVNPQPARIDHWWEFPGTASLLMEEYNKLLLATLKASLHYLMV
ncbi:MAG: YdcF family protein [Alphaproteobacteria bacterium]|nr:YdcF family protein [Alphaproteobacteria bacterium]